MKIINKSFQFSGSFERKSLSATKEKIPVPNGWFVLPYSIVPNKSDRRKYHGKWFKIKSDNDTIYRVLRFKGGMKGTIKNDSTKEILLDWIGWIDLCGRDETVDTSLELTFNHVKGLEKIKAGLNHPEPSFRLSAILALLSVGLGFFSIIITVVISCIIG